ncbi:hypothetical protein XELAEV_18003897mg [Xenopus laevis]|uniref:Uncharacterized protein n=1 Tax=Xenopus laevis TaxID=8355 RepID=A0A974BN17_XENLA|nr:hypothetical protein XELAEV_18003897mg [Xenopus laevis]
MGAFFKGLWCAERWPSSWLKSDLIRNLTFLELFPILVSIVLWGNELRNSRVIFYCDNLSVVNVVNRQTATSLPVLTILRQLVLQCLKFKGILSWEKKKFQNG